MTVDPVAFRAALAQWPSGVGVVTTLTADGAQWKPHGMTASSFSSVSLDPPLVSICVANHLPTRAMIHASGVFAISILGRDQSEVGKRFAGLDPEVRDRFAGLAVTTAATGCPVLTEANAWLDCEVAHAYPGGDHTIFVGRVRAAATPRTGAPLLFHSRTWGQFADPLPERIAITLIDAEVNGFANPGHDDIVIGDAFAPAHEDRVLAELAAVEQGTIVLAEGDTAPPVQVRRVLQDALAGGRHRPLRVRLRAHHGLGLVNALVAMKSGVRHFDTALDGAGGLLRTEDLIFLARQLGLSCPTLPNAHTI